MIVLKGKGPTTRAGFKYDNKGRLLDADGNESASRCYHLLVAKLGDAAGSQTKQDLSKNRHSNGLIDFSVLGQARQ